MILAQEATDTPTTERVTISHHGTVQPNRKAVDSDWDRHTPQQITPLDPLTRRFKNKRTFPGVGQDFVMLLVIDTSGSVKGPPLAGIKRSAVEFVDLLGDTDRCAIMTFNDEASLIVPFMSDKARLRSEIAGLQPKGRNTVLFDALDRAFVLLKREKEKQRFVVLFSDGKDEGSRLTSGEVIGKARKSQISVFCLGYSQIEREYLGTLEALSQETGGLFAEAPHFQEIVELFRAAKTSIRQKGAASPSMVGQSSG
jgi:Mg-chelatase subunit ChlD